MQCGETARTSTVPMANKMAPFVGSQAGAAGDDG